ncbi:hypothetical protein HYY75_11205, partial [bacterium]|nr:hypothetical protein [bacterium]
MSMTNSPGLINQSTSPEEIEQEFLQIKQALLENHSLLENMLSKRMKSPRPWKFVGNDVPIGQSSETIDLVFEHPDNDDKRFVLIALSIPHLQKGKKFSLDSKSKLFQKEKNLGMSRVKKAILMIRKENTPFSPPGNKLHCPIIELKLSDLFHRKPSETSAPASVPVAKVLPENLLEMLKQSIVQECLATLNKRRNKYVRKGLWKWVEREITDPNIHFFLVVLSSIYQGKTSEVLSRKFKSVEDYSKSPDQVLDAVFSNESVLADEIIKNEERHKKALKKFLECFSQTPPFEYLRSLFLKEFRTTRDSTKSRLIVFNTLRELLGRCGFQGEKETQYPLEILDELGIFQGLIAGNYAELRVENAAKKLRHMIPQISWTSDEVYKLRDELSHRLKLPSSEFNLNAFLPQTFFKISPQETKINPSAISLPPLPNPNLVERGSLAAKPSEPQNQPLNLANPEKNQNKLALSSPHTGEKNPASK